MKKTSFARFLFILTASFLCLCCTGKRIRCEKPNGWYNPSFVQPVLYKDSLSDWKKATFGAAKSDTIRWNGQLYLGTVADNQLVMAQHFSLQHLFVIPVSSKTLSIRLTGCFVYAEGTTSPVFLVVRKYVKGVVVEKDSVNLLKTSKLHSWSSNFPLPGLCSDVDVSIESRAPASYLLDSMVVQVDGVDVADVACGVNKPLSPVEKKNLKKNTSNAFPLKQQPRILGIGESVHGSKQLITEQYRLIRQLIVERRLDLLLLECSQPVGERLNGYVTGNSATLGGTDDLGLYANQCFFELLAYMRRVNMNRKDQPLQVGGYDVTFSLWPTGLPSSSLRDSLMFVRVREVAERLGPNHKVVVQGHLGHLIKTVDYGKPEFTAPLGYYLDKAYGDDFKVLGLFVGTGERLCKVYRAGAGMVMDTVQLVRPMNNSLEQRCLQVGLNAFYVTGWQDKPWMDKVYRCRRGGLTLADAEFFPFNVNDMDVVYFTDRSEPF